MAFSDNQVQLRKHGDAVLGPGRGEPEPVRSIALWREINLRAVEQGERLGERYLRVRFEDLAAEPAATTESVLAFLGLDEDAERIAADEVRAPNTLGRWRGQEVGPLEAVAGDALSRLGYQSSSE
jgi:hypothetical protein